MGYIEELEQQNEQLQQKLANAERKVAYQNKYMKRYWKLVAENTHNDGSLVTLVRNPIPLTVITKMLHIDSIRLQKVSPFSLCISTHFINISRMCGNCNRFDIIAYPNVIRNINNTTIFNYMEYKWFLKINVGIKSGFEFADLVFENYTEMVEAIDKYINDNIHKKWFCD